MIQPTAPSLSLVPSLLAPAPVGDGLAFTASLATMLDAALPCGLPVAGAGKGLPAAAGLPLLKTAAGTVDPGALPPIRGLEFATLSTLPSPAEPARAQPAAAAIATLMTQALSIEPLAPTIPDMPAPAPVPPPIPAAWRAVPARLAHAAIAGEALPAGAAAETPPHHVVPSEAPAAAGIGPADARASITASLRSTASPGAMAAGLVADLSDVSKLDQPAPPPHSHAVTAPTILAVPFQLPPVSAAPSAITTPEAPGDNVVDSKAIALDDAAADLAPAATPPPSLPIDLRTSRPAMAIAPPRAAIPSAPASGPAADHAPARLAIGGFTPERLPARAIESEQEQGQELGRQPGQSALRPLVRLSESAAIGDGAVPFREADDSASAEQPLLAPAPALTSTPAGVEAQSLPIHPGEPPSIGAMPSPTHVPADSLTSVPPPVRHAASVLRPAAAVVNGNPPTILAPDTLRPAQPAADAPVHGALGPDPSASEATIPLQSVPDAFVGTFRGSVPIPSVVTAAPAVKISSPAPANAASGPASPPDGIAELISAPLPSITPPAAPLPPARLAAPSGRRMPQAGSEGVAALSAEGLVVQHAPVPRPLANHPPQAAPAARIEADPAALPPSPAATRTREPEARAVSRDPRAPSPIRVASPGSEPLPLVAGASAPAFRLFAAAIHAARADEGAGAPPLGAAAISLVEQVRAPLAATAAEGAPLDMTDRAWPQTMVDRIDTLREAASAVRDAASTSIRLVPDALGTIDVSVRNVGDTVHVHFAAAQPETRTLLAEAQPRLSELAEARGIKLAQADVGTGGQGPTQGQSQGQQRPAPQPANRTAPAAAARGDEPELATTRIA